MTSADRNWENQLNDYLDALAGGTPPTTGDLDPYMQEAVKRFFAHDDAPAPRAGRASQILEDLMNQFAHAGTIPQTPSIITQPSHNGRLSPPPVRMPIPLTRPAPAHRHWRFALIAVAALLLVTLGFGFRAFDPFGSGSEQPSSIPAAVAPVASPTATPYPMTDHPFVGVWKWSVDGDPGCCAPGIADADGTYVNYDPKLGGGVGIGTWRATGPRTAELSFVNQFVVPRDMFDPSQVLAGVVLSPAMNVSLITITVDESGNTATYKGSINIYDAAGNFLVGGDDIDWTGVRLVPDPSTTATPTS